MLHKNPRDTLGRFVVRDVVDNVSAVGNKFTLMDAVQVFTAMKAGAVVRRMDPNRAWAKFHRIQDGEVQTADTADKMVAGDWHRAQTDVASWYASKFARVTVKVVNVEVNYT
jgi:hypothetical protein